MPQDFPQSVSKLTPLLALLGALVMAAGLFLLIPLTQTLEAARPKVISYREVAVAAPPPPKAPPPSSRSESTLRREAEKPRLERSTPELTLNQLEISLNPGMGAPLTMGLQGIEFAAEIDVVGDIEKIFAFEDLPQPPQLINASQLGYTFPRDLERRGVKEVRVVMQILIDERGRSHVEKMLSISRQHAEIERAARRLAAKARFTVTKIDGTPVKVRAKFPFLLKAQ